MRSHVLYAVALAASSFVRPAAQAQTSLADTTVAHGALTRAQVMQELAQYRRSGVNPWSTSYNPLRTFRSEKSREQVRAEFVAHRDAAKQMLGEDSGSVFLALQKAVTLPAELLEFAADGRPTASAQFAHAEFDRRFRP